MKKYFININQARCRLQRKAALTMAAVLAAMAILPYVPHLRAEAAVEIGEEIVLTSAHGNYAGGKLYCIDRNPYHLWGVADDGDTYRRQDPYSLSLPLTEEELTYAFWGMLSLKASKGDEKAAGVIRAIRTAAGASGKTAITNLVNEENLKVIIHDASYRARYPWLETVAANSEEYMIMGGLIGSGDGGGVGGGSAPDILRSSTSLSTAYQVDMATMTIPFEPEDADFVRTVPLLFSNDNGATWSPTSPDGWTYQKTDTGIIFTNPNPEAPSALIQFAVEGTAYANGSGGYSSAEDVISQCLRIYECVACSGNHTGNAPAVLEPWLHQRLVDIEIQTRPVTYYAAIGGDPVPVPGAAPKGEVTFDVYRHEEDFTASYNVQLYKFDHETGQPLQGARFALYERFDDQAKVDTVSDGREALYEGGGEYAGGYLDSTVLWDGFRNVGSLTTDAEGRVAKTILHEYHYDKTFCSGHEAPSYVVVPAPIEEEDEETGDVTIVNQDEIDAAKAENRLLSDTWLASFEDCESHASDWDGVHFHWLLDTVEVEVIEEVASSGGEENDSAPDAGQTEGADGPTAYAESGCQADCEATYEKFIAMRYSYAFEEYKARDGYSLHDTHSDDLPVEIITTDSSENGANAGFAGIYGKDTVLGTTASAWAAGRTEGSARDSASEGGASLFSLLFPALFSPGGRETGAEKEFPAPWSRDRIQMSVLPYTAGQGLMASPSDAMPYFSGMAASFSELSVRASGAAASFFELAARSSRAAASSSELAARSSRAAASPSELAARSSGAAASPSEAAFAFRTGTESVQPFSLTGLRAASGASLFWDEYEEALTENSEGDGIEPLDDGNYSHCNRVDGEDNAWRVYDHRTEGEFHINKRDLDLRAGETEEYSAYGDTQGDGTLEGAVYGLFAAEDITHPDGKTGVVYRANNLVAVAATDKNGDASFLVNTEAPGKTYDYAAGSIVDTADGWNAAAPENLYVAEASYDDYTEDGQYRRAYTGNEADNGNCWIGRPLLLGDYYVKELSRSEGYELSIGNKRHALTNFGQDVELQAPEGGTGWAHVKEQMYAEEQTGEGGAMPNEIFFSAESRDTRDASYDLVLSNLPEGAKVYRKDIGSGEVEVEAGTGTFLPVETGNYVVAEHGRQYPKYNADGSLMTREVPVSYVASLFRQVGSVGIDAAVVQKVLETAEGTMTEAENTALLADDFTASDFTYVKSKVETSLRRNGKQTPASKKDDGTYAYSGIYAGVFDRGVREGDADQYGLSGVTPGQPAAVTVYGSPVLSVSIPRVTAGIPLTVGSAITTILDFYNSHPFYSYGGIDSVAEEADAFVFSVYASVAGNPKDFMVPGSDPETDSVIYHAAEYLPDDAALVPRYVYVPYSNNPARDAFGTYTGYSDLVSGSSVFCNATLITDVIIDGAGVARTKTVTENVYYNAGETPLDAAGNPIKEVVYQEVTRKETIYVDSVLWTELPAERTADGRYVVQVEAAFSDAFGTDWTNQGTPQTLGFKVVLPEEMVILTAEDAALLGDGYTAGREMNSAAYYVMAAQARAKAYLDYENMSLVGGDTYIELVSLDYPGERQVYQDAGTRGEAAGVSERIIRQKVKIVKDIETTPEGAASTLPGFRFKIYLKSNLERLYRDEAGEVTWLDRDGNEVDISAFRAAYPSGTAPESASVQKLYTRVPHLAGSRTAGPLNNNLRAEAVTANDALYSYENGQIKAEQNAGYTRLLETIMVRMEDGAGKTREVEAYNYEKFFDALRVANEDQWDGTGISTSFKPPAWIRALSFAEDGNARKDPVVRSNPQITNTANTGIEAAENARRTDNVRQFAIDWYVTDEAAKLMEENARNENQPAGGSESYQDEIYDKALHAAILKAENYLKPFFAYDLDEIYAVEWDGAAEGGGDKDPDTLSADTFYGTEGNGKETAKNGYYYGVSAYLPYGEYVAVEQQPGNGVSGDFENRHYKTDRPKEILVPSVYEAGGNEVSPERFAEFYQYTASDTPEELAAKYQIRMNEEWGERNTADLRSYVIRGHNHDGDFEVYKYGLDADRLAGTIAYSGGSYSYAGFTVSQEEFDPYKDVYEGENTASDYKKNQAVEKYYRYASLSEQAGTADGVLYRYGADTDGSNPSGFYFKDDVTTITGSLTGYDGRYFSALVPMTMTEPKESAAYQAGSFTGYADGKYRNTFYISRLRIEKLDSETGENILHDGAVFAIYSAQREDEKEGDGRVKFYEEDTLITGSKEFLQAMGADWITPLARPSLPWELPYNGKYYGIVPAGTPVCWEEEQVILTDASGNRTGSFRVFSTTRDGTMEGITGNQNAGYLETPEPLGAGCYVLCELKAPAGYVRNRPVAIEIYSDEVTYYLDGDRDRRVRAAIYEKKMDRTAEEGENREQGEISRIYMNNTPIRLEISKTKPEEAKAVFELNGRLEGSLIELSARYGLENLELAYRDSGTYLGYGWKKGFLDSLRQSQKAGENLTVLYENGVFTGKAQLTKIRETADDTNRYLPGAVMTLYEAIEIKPTADSEDYGYYGVNVVRDRFGNVKNIYVQKGYAGQEACYVLNKTDSDSDGLEDYSNYSQEDSENDTGSGEWILKTAEREDTDILFYDLSGLSVFQQLRGISYGYDKNGNLVQAKEGQSLYALKDGTPFLEILCPDIENLHYSAKDRVFDRVPEGTEVYHLDADGIRDSRVDPYTGMAYVTERATGKVMVWPVDVSEDEFGNVTAREKRKTSRPASIYADTEKEYTIGTWDGTAFQKSANPVLNEYGQPEYYQRSNLVYQKGEPVYDRDGDYIRFRYENRLRAYNRNAWMIDPLPALLDIGAEAESASDDKPLYHRQGEAYLIENTWTTGERTPNDPFRTEMSSGQVDVLKRVPAGVYILEEVKAPSGYSKTMPEGLTVTEQTAVHTARAVDIPISAWFEKTDAPESWQLPVLDPEQLLPEPEIRTEGKGGYSFGQVEGAELALYKARKIPADDLEIDPSGYRLEKAEEHPASWEVTEDDGEKRTVAARWTTGELPQYLEGIPAGLYLLEELSVPPGFLPASAEVEIRETEALQYFTLPNDHSKVEILKYTGEEGSAVPVSASDGVKLALYEAVTDEQGVVMQEGIPLYQTDRLVDSWIATDCREYTAGEEGEASGFTDRFEQLYQEYGPDFALISWETGQGEQQALRLETEQSEQAESVRQLWETEDGRQIQIDISRGLKTDGSFGLIFDYKFNYRKLSVSGSPYAVSYDTVFGTHRIDYLDCKGGKAYVLAELEAPDGFCRAQPKVVFVEETAAIQLFGLKNEPNYMEILKVTEGEEPLPGAELALYRADETGGFTEDSAYLIERWISDFGPHKISPLAEGTYYLVELTAPEGFLPMQPKRIFLSEGVPVSLKAENQIKKGQVEIWKYDAQDIEKGLSGALFEVKNLDTGERWQFATDEAGGGKSGLLDTGCWKDGAWIPYRFTLQEIRPPKTYALNRRIQTFSFADGEEEILLYRNGFLNEPTRIEIAKTDFADGSPVAGAKLAVYRAKEQDGSYAAVGEALETWISDGTSHTIRGKLSAGELYLLMELETPEGYAKKEPVLFSLSDDGRQISSVSGNCGVVSFQAAREFPDNIESVSVWGRKAVGTKLILTELKSGKVIEFQDRYPAVLTASDGLTEGERYEEREETCFSDGSTRTIRRRIFTLRFDEEGAYTPIWRLPEETILDIEEFAEEDGEGKEESTETAGGKTLVSWVVENSGEKGYFHTIWNPEYEERNGIQTVSQNGSLGEAVLPGTVIRYEICCVNTGTEKQNKRISVQLDEQTEWMPANSDAAWKKEGACLTAELSGLEPGEERRLILAAAIKPEAEREISCKALIDGRTFRETHPVSQAGAVSLVNRVTGTAADTAEGTFSYRIRFFDREGEELKGAVSYISPRMLSGSGTMRSGEELTLSSGEFLTFTGLPWGTLCQIEETKESRQDSELEFHSLSAGQAEAAAGSRPATILFSYEKRDGSRREIFQKGRRYVWKERVTYSDGTSIQTGSHSFALDEEGAAIWMDFTNEKTELLIEKTDRSTGKPLAGASLQLWGETLLEQWVSGETEPHRIQAVIRPGETLLLRETDAPEGYGMAEDMPVAVPEEGGCLLVSMEDQPIRAVIRKIALDSDGVTKLGPLAGAVIRIETEEGTELFRFETGEDGAAVLPPVLEPGKTYYAVEEKAPEGYEKAAPVSFSVPEAGGEVEVIIYDKRIEKPEQPTEPEQPEEPKEPEEKPEEPDKPENPEDTPGEPEPRPNRPGGTGGTGDQALETEPVPLETPIPLEGTITVHYDDILRGKGSIRLSYKPLSPLPRTGEEMGEGRAAEWYIGLCLFAASVFLYALLLYWKRKEAQEEA